MSLFAFHLNATLALLFLFSSIVNALHGETLGTPWTKHHVRLRTHNKQVVLESSPEHPDVTRLLVSTSTLPSSNLSDISPQDTDNHLNIQHAQTSFQEQDACPDASSKMLVMGYYPDWAYPAFPPEDIDFGRYDWIDFAFALPNASFALVWDDMNSGPELLTRLVAAAHAGGSKVKLSIGGWTGSK
jgi:hypothetical protein